MPRPHSGALSDDARLTSDDVWRLSIAYIGPKSRTERPRKTKIGTEVAHVTRDSDTTFKVKMSKVNLPGAGYIVAASHTACFALLWCIIFLFFFTQLLSYYIVVHAVFAKQDGPERCRTSWWSVSSQRGAEVSTSPLWNNCDQRPALWIPAPSCTTVSHRTLSCRWQTARRTSVQMHWRCLTS